MLLSDKIKACLIQLRDIEGWKNNALAERIGVGESYLSQLYKGTNTSDSELLFRCLTILIQLEKLKRAPKPKTTEEQLAGVLAEVAALKAALPSAAKQIESYRNEQRKLKRRKPSD